MGGYQDKLGEPQLEQDIDASVRYLLQHAAYVSAEQWARLERIGARFAPVPVVAEAEPVSIYGADFSLANELESQIRAVRAVRERVIDSRGQLQDDITTREAKEVIASGSTLLGTLMKYHEKVVNMERMRLLEQSVIEVLEEEDEEVKDRVLMKMEEKLENMGGY